MNTTQDSFSSVMFSTFPHLTDHEFSDEAGMSHRSEGPSELMLSASSSFQLSEFSSSDEDEGNCAGSLPAVQGASNLQLKDLLGRGSCGSVYKAVWKGLPVAVKVYLAYSHT